MSKLFQLLLNATRMSDIRTYGVGHNISIEQERWMNIDIRGAARPSTEYSDEVCELSTC